MNFTVLWTEEAFDAIQEIVASAADPDPIVAVIRELDEQLRDEPATRVNRGWEAVEFFLRLRSGC